MTIAEVHSHLAAGNQVAIVTYGHCMVLTRKHIDYIRQDADGKGFRLGWPGKKSVYTFAHSVRMVPAGMKVGR